MDIETPIDILSHHATRSSAESFAAWRKRIRKPLTNTAALRIAKTLYDILAAGGDADDALGLAEERGWQSIRFDWYFNAKAPRANTTPDIIALAASARRSPRQDWF